MNTSTPISGIFLKGISLRALLAHQAGERPHAVAVTHAGGALTFRQLNAAAHRLGSHLADLGVAPDTCVGLYTEPSADLMTGAWGILTAGAAYLPLSPDYPEERLGYMLENSGTRVIVTQDHLRERARRLAPEGTTVVTLTDAPALPSGPLPETHGDHLAYVIYTSGSTGKPKGVLIEQRSIVSQMQWLANCGHLGPEVSILQKTPMSFDAAQWEILAPATGARVVMGNPGIFRDPEGITTMIREHEVTALQAVPTLLQALVDTEEFSACRSLTRVFSGGEALTRGLAQDLFAALPGISVVNLYGPTETTINATSQWIDPDTLGDSPSGIVPIGVPADNVTCYILDENMQPVDIGESGELFIGGVQVARGYLGMPEQTGRHNPNRFIISPFNPTERLYRTGDLCKWHPDGTIQFIGRTDNQVKLRGYRVELEEVASRIEEHTWVRRAAALVTDDARTGHKALVAAVELNERTAAVMDQGREDAAHHQSKASKVQVRAQLSNPGLREPAELDGRRAVTLPGQDATDEQRRETFARKTYRFYDGGPVTVRDVLGLLAPRGRPSYARPLTELSLDELGQLLRWFGPFRSEERLLPKYSYASPGALYATQMYLETSGLSCLPAGVYYFHPVDHTLVRVGEASEGFPEQGLQVHFLGRKRAIEPVYKNNIVEVLEFETGHMVGVFEEVLPGFGLTIAPAGFEPGVKARLDVADDDQYLGTFAVTENDGPERPDEVELFVQAHDDGVEGLEAGLYLHRDGRLDRLGAETVEKRHVIAINQGVFERASFGISAVSRVEEAWLHHIVLGTKLHHLQRTPGLGLMSSGYSSKTGNPLPASRRLDELLAAAGVPAAPASYFLVGGRISDEQAAHEGMNEDAVHTKGPAELIRDDLARFLPDYMIPARVLVVNALPLTANGKIDAKAAAQLPEIAAAQTSTVYVAPATATELWLAGEWGRLLKYDDVSTQDEFFASGGNSLHAVALVNRINRVFGVNRPLQVIFESPKLEDLAARIDDDAPRHVSRLVPLHTGGAQRPVFCWPGLGGYPMNLRLLGASASGDRPFYGIQAHGINPGETPYGTIREMAMADVSEIRRVQPSGPYTLWGYSFGARVAFEAAWQLERSGEKVENLLLICPGNPQVRGEDGQQWGREASYGNPAYLTILFSVFTGTVHGPHLEACLDEATDESSFVEFVHGLLPALDAGTIRRITRIVAETYEFEYSFRELQERRIEAPVTIFKARGDDYSFVEGSSGYSAKPPAIVDLDGDHYSVLKEHGVGELVARIRDSRTSDPRRIPAADPVPTLPALPTEGTR
ncbi:amino acid adenylation domain-containing protein [Streptomyces montanus]|uniref:Amino acid adenylation domain-containing protein n=1 Tax=Streptomyces montanus TaxID=2580423 RepID=A0A5R9FM96_9ACTN|nr:amino acid adenylation domain-containing protein [Streptomyces montanus]TLS45047.1 amino acid adenylation domain-containing protein [Streptomyces montanus]